MNDGRSRDGWSHYQNHGRRENRDARFGDFDPVFYSNSYPQAREEVASGRAARMLDHYLKIGRAQGYLPNKQAPRPDNPDCIRSRFGGLWFDAANGEDLYSREGRNRHYHHGAGDASLF